MKHWIITTFPSHSLLNLWQQRRRKQVRGRSGSDNIIYSVDDRETADLSNFPLKSALLHDGFILDDILQTPFLRFHEGLK